MTLLAPNVGEVKLLSYALNKASAEDQILKLYTNNHTPVEGDVAGSYTEATFTGYSSHSLAGSGWTVATSGGVTTASRAIETFMSTADQTAQLVYGYYIVGASSGVLLWAELFSDGPYTISVNGDSINITPKITLDGDAD
jgi:hypothetical protein